MVDAFAVRSGDGEARWWLGALAVIKATAADTGGHLALVDVTDPPGVEAPLHVHHKEDEAFWVLEGDVTFEVGGKTIQAGAGDFVFGPRDAPPPLQGRRRRLPDALHVYPGRIRGAGQGDKRPGPQPHAPPGRPSDARRATDDGRTSRRGLRAGRLKPARPTRVLHSHGSGSHCRRRRMCRFRVTAAPRRRRVATAGLDDDRKRGPRFPAAGIGAIRREASCGPGPSGRGGRGRCR